MSIKEGTIPIQFRIGENFSSDFDELQNIEIANRKSDIGFSEFSLMSIKMRPGTSKVGDDISGSGGINDQIFFLDFYKKKHHMKAYNNKIYRLDGSTWTDIGGTFTSNDFSLNPLLLPMMLDGSIPTVYTTTADATTSERVKKAAGDGLGAGAIGKYLIITENTANSEAYRGAFASILDYDSGTSEYTLNGAGVTTVLKSGAKYQIYDTLGEYLQVTNGTDFDAYFFGKSDGTIITNATFLGLATKGLRNVKGILDSEFIIKQIGYSNSYWTFNKNTLYYTAGTLNNPFLYNFTTVLSIPGSVGGAINDLFVFKDRLIIGGTIYAAYLKGPISALTEIKMITESYGISPGTLADVGVDAFFLSTNQHIYSLKENIAGTALISADEGKVIRNYLKDYNFNLMGAFDGSKLYFYGEKVEGTTGTMVVLDIQFKFWSVYTGLPISSIIFNEGSVYLADNNSDNIRIFDDTLFQDLGVAIEQKVSLKDISAGDPFILKSLTDSYLWLDNFVQDLEVSLYAANPGTNTKKNTKRIKLTADDVGASSPSMGETAVGEGILGGTAIDINMTLPIMKKLTYSKDNALLWKIIIIGKDGSPFYLNQLDVEISVDDKTYFSPNNTL